MMAEEKDKYYRNLKQLEQNLSRLDREYQALIVQNEKQQEVSRKKKEMEQLQDCVEKLKMKVRERLTRLEPIIGLRVPDAFVRGDSELHHARVFH